MLKRKRESHQVGEQGQQNINENAERGLGKCKETYIVKKTLSKGGGTRKNTTRRLRRKNPGRKPAVQRKRN